MYNRKATFERVNMLKTKRGPLSSICWTGNRNLILSNRLGLFCNFDIRCSFSSANSFSRVNSTLNQIEISEFCFENNLLALGGNEKKIVIFDIRNLKEPVQKFNLPYSKNIQIIYLMLFYSSELV